MNVTDLVNLFANVCFPVLVSSYLLIRIEKRLINQTESLNKLNTIISTKLGVVIDAAPKEDKNDDATQKGGEINGCYKNI